MGALTSLDDRYDTVDAVVHLAAIPAPGIAPNAATFANNVLATYHVLEAARVAGITRVVIASSETVLGLPFETPPPYLPIDEEYRVRPETSYSLGKAVDEEVAHHFCRWNPDLTVIALRFSNVMEPQEYAGFAEFQDDARLRSWNAWGYIDARDGAQAVRKALEADIAGYDVFIVANADTCMTRPSAGARRRGVPGRAVDPRGDGHGDAALHRQGTPPARLRAPALLARRRHRRDLTAQAVRGVLS